MFSRGHVLGALPEDHLVKGDVRRALTKQLADATRVDLYIDFFKRVELPALLRIVVNKTL